MFLINFGSHHRLKMATYSVHSFVFFVFFQISSKLNLFSCTDGVYSLSMILCLFWCKKDLGVKAFNSVAFVFSNTLTVAFLLKHYSNKNAFFPVMFVNVSLAMFLKCFLRFRHFEPHVNINIKRVFQRKID